MDIRDYLILMLMGIIQAGLLYVLIYALYIIYKNNKRGVVDMSKDRLSLDETIKQLDKRNKSDYSIDTTLRSLQYHLDVIAEYSKQYGESELLRYKIVADQSKQVIINTFEELLKDKQS
jgi:hypothetical protein